MKDLIKTPEIKPKKTIRPHIFVKPSSLNSKEKGLRKKLFLRLSDDKKDKIQEICKKLYGHRLSKECIRYKTVQKLLDTQEKYVDKMAVGVLEHQLKKISSVAEFYKTKSVKEYNFYTKLEFILRTLFLERGEPFWHKMFESSKESPFNIIDELYYIGWCYGAKQEIPAMWKHCLLNDLDLFSQEENKKVVGIISSLYSYRSLPEV